MNVVLIGMKHCGKTTVGEALARRWSVPFVDTDDLLADLHAQRTGQRKSVREIFADHGPEHFASLEADVVASLPGKLADGGVVALGGRTATQPGLAEPIGELGTVAYLRVDPETLFERVAAGGIPPFLDPADPKGSFLRLAEKRAVAYRALADVTVDLDGLDIPAAINAVAAAIASPDADAPAPPNTATTDTNQGT